MRPQGARATLLTLLFLSCTPPKTESATPPKHEAAHDHDALPSHVRLSADVAKKAKLHVVEATEKKLSGTLDLTGEIVADPDARAVVTARINARIVDVRFRENDKVTQGQTLLVLESGELARARAALTTSEGKAKVAKKNHERLEALSEKGLSSGQELESAKAEAASAQADATAARQTLMAFGPNALDVTGDAARLTITAPINGRVLSRQAVRGEGVTPDRVLAELANLDEAYFQARVFEKDLVAIAAGSKAEVRLNAFPDTVFLGKVESIGRQVDPAARTVLSRIRVENQSDLLKVGLFGTARIVDAASTRASRPSLVAPLSAVTELAGKHVVFVQVNDDDFEVHEVRTGRSAEGEIEILSGLRAGERVVADGVFTLKSALLKHTFGEED